MFQKNNKSIEELEILLSLIKQGIPQKNIEKKIASALTKNSKLSSNLIENKLLQATRAPIEDNFIERGWKNAEVTLKRYKKYI